MEAPLPVESTPLPPVEELLARAEALRHLAHKALRRERRMAARAQRAARPQRAAATVDVIERVEAQEAMVRAVRGLADLPLRVDAPFAEGPSPRREASMSRKTRRIEGPAPPRRRLEPGALVGRHEHAEGRALGSPLVAAQTRERYDCSAKERPAARNSRGAERVRAAVASSEDPVKRRVRALLFLGALLGASHSGACAGEAADLAAGFVDPSPEVRAAAAAKVGTADLIAAAAAIPVLVEALDDEAPAVRAAARAAILDLANRAVPSVLRDLTEAPMTEGPDSVAGVVLLLGPALTPSDLAHALSSGAQDFRVDSLCVALFGADDIDQEWSTKSELRMAAIEAEHRGAPEKAEAAAAAAFLAFRVVRARAKAQGEPMPVLAAPGAQKKLTSLLPGKASGPRSEFAAQFVAVTGIGDETLVDGLKALLAAAPASEPRASPFPGAGPSLQAAGALGRLAGSVPAARAVLEALDDARFADVAIAVARGGATSLVAARAAAASAADRVIRAATAVLDGDARTPALVPVLAAALSEPTLSGPGRLAANALGRLGAGAAASVPALEAALRVKDLSKADRVALGGALVRIRPGHEAGQEALLAEATGKTGPPDPRAGSAEVEAHDLAIEALAAGGTGEEVATVLVSALHPLDSATGESLEVVARMEAAARGLETAGWEAATPFRLRAAALDALARLRSVSSAEQEALRSLSLASQDPRIAYRAARARRQLLITGR
jgi:hypothetical protein